MALAVDTQLNQFFHTQSHQISQGTFAEDTELFHCLGSERFVAGTTYM